MGILGVIPARYDSTRFPGKPLALVGKIPMIVRVVLQAQKTHLLDRIVVATDDKRIEDVIRAEGFEVIMTSRDHKSGSDRLGEVAQAVPADIYVNIQGDEPFILPEIIDDTVLALIHHHQWDITTTAIPFNSRKEWEDPNRVKVICSDNLEALLFTRCPIPYTKNPGVPANVFRHLGLYAYRQKVLNAFSTLPVHPVEREESLEQLRLLMAGFHIGVVLSEQDSPSVDVPEDLHILHEWMKENQIK
jgi:3-deoxy-manno-octulosonate cytidylyltransferase (CMP-KDO synthetase)